MKNCLKEKMKTRPVFGLTVYSGCAAVIEIMGQMGYDFAFIDTEHATPGLDNLKEMILAARLNGISPLVRVTRPDEIEIRKVLELGAEGVIIPHVHNKKEMEECIRGAKFPPLGRRGYDSSVRSAGYGMVNYDANKYIDYSNDTELVIPMAEDYEFIDNIDDVFSVKGIDVINFGPADYALSTNTRKFYDMTLPVVDEALKKIVNYSKKDDISVMAPAVPPTQENIKSLIDKGVNMIICGNDMMAIGNYLKDAMTNGIYPIMEEK